MQVKALVSFSSFINGELQIWPIGHVAELPAGQNWLALGWVEAIDAPAAGKIASSPAADLAQGGYVAAGLVFGERAPEPEPDTPPAARRPARRPAAGKAGKHGG